MKPVRLSRMRSMARTELEREVIDALEEAAREADSVGFAVSRNLIGREEAYKRLEVAHALRTAAVAKLPAWHKWKPILDELIRSRGEHLAKLIQ